MADGKEKPAAFEVQFLTPEGYSGRYRLHETGTAQHPRLPKIVAELLRRMKKDGCVVVEMDAWAKWPREQLSLQMPKEWKRNA